MKTTGRCAIAKYATRGKQYVVLLRPFDDGIVLQQLYYRDEIRSFGEVPMGEEVDLKKGELELAIQLIEQIAADEFSADGYEDEVRARIRAAIQQKIAGKKITAVFEEAPKAQIIDLMEALKASVGGSGKRKPAKRVAKRAASAETDAKPTKAKAKARKRSNG